MVKDKGVEFLMVEMEGEFVGLWKEDGEEKKVVMFFIYLLIGRVGGDCV